ncbi:MAG: hypothetical protein JXR23_04865 [Pontiellaceae bacterium]|nr:hypothetical protein [Pontiellaceae bacterium]
MRYICFVLFFSAVCVQAEMRTWTSQTGDTFEGEMVRESGPDVVLKGLDDRSIKVPLSGLSDEDQEYVRFKRPIELKIEISIRANVIENPPIQSEIISDSHTVGGGTQESGYYPLVKIKKGLKPIDKQLDVYVLVFDPERRLMAHDRTENIQFSDENNYFAGAFTGAIFQLTDYGFTLVLVVDKKGNIVASDATQKSALKALNLEELFARELGYFLLQKYYLSGTGRDRPFTLSFSAIALSEDQEKALPHGIVESIREVVDGGFKVYLDHIETQIEERSLRPSRTELFSFRRPFMSFLGFPPSSDRSVLPESKWVAWCKEVMQVERSTTFRFVAQSEGLLVIGVDGKPVFNNDSALGELSEEAIVREGVIPFSEHAAYAFSGEWISVGEGQVILLDIMMTPSEELRSETVLFVEEKGVEYPEDSIGNPILPLFSTVEIPEEVLDVVYKDVCPEGVEPPEPFVMASP